MVRRCPASPPDPRIAAVRRFSRFYTRVIGALQEGLLQSDFSLTEARVLYELANHDGVTASTFGRDLGLDPGYLSRILQRFAQHGLLARAVSETDRRQSVLALTDAGRTAFAPLDARSHEEVGAMLARLPEPAQAAVVDCMARIECLLGATPPAAWRLRDPEPGDIGWVVSRHGALYAEEYGVDPRFEALVAQVAGAFLASHDPARERCWIAERDSVKLGSVFLVRADDDLAKLRLLLVEPARAAWESASGWWRNASPSPALRAIGASRCGPMTCWWRHGESTGPPDSGWWPASRTAISAPRWWGRIGI